MWWTKLPPNLRLWVRLPAGTCAESDGIKHIARCVKTMLQQYPHIRLHRYSSNTEGVAEHLDKGLLNFAIIVLEVDLSKYNYLEVPATDVYGVVMRKDSPLAMKETVQMEDLLDFPLICSRHGEAFPKLFMEKMDTLNVVALFNLCYNSSVLVR